MEYQEFSDKPELNKYLICAGLLIASMSTAQVNLLRYDSIPVKSDSIKYFKNTGTLANAFFSAVPTNGFFGGVDVMPDCCTGYCIPFLTPLDSTGGYFLFAGSEQGWIRLYKVVESDLSAPFLLADSMIKIVLK